MSEENATAVLISLIGGIFLAIALSANFESGVIVWFLTSISSGIFLGRIENLQIFSLKKVYFLSAFTLSGTPIFFFYTKAIFSFIQHSQNLQFTVVWSTFEVSPLDPLFIFLTSLLFIFCFIGSVVLISVSTSASRVLLRGASQLYKFGPKSIERIRLILTALTGVLSATFALVAVLSS